MPIENPEHAYREYMPELAPGERFSQHHIKAREADISRYCFIPGSHLRGRRIAERMEKARVVSATRGYWVYSGYYNGEFLTVCSTGMGGPVVAIAMEELGRMGADTFIRVGSAGAGQDYLGVGDIVVATATCRFGGTSYNYLPSQFPSVADFGITRTLVETAERLGIAVHAGVCRAGDAFYAPKDPNLRETLKQAGVLAGEMESDLQFILGAFRGWRCGAAFVLDGGPAKKIQESSAKDLTIAHHATNPDYLRGEDNLITICLEAMAAVSKADKARQK